MPNVTAVGTFYFFGLNEDKHSLFPMNHSASRALPASKLQQTHTQTHSSHTSHSFTQTNTSATLTAVHMTTCVIALAANLAGGRVVGEFSVTYPATSLHNGAISVYLFFSSAKA